MSPSYLVRLLVLSSASFFLIQLAMAALIAWLAPRAIRRAQTMGPSIAARFLLTLRLLPAGFAALIVAALCVPSYLRFEPRIGEEEVGIACAAAAILGLTTMAIALYRALRALIHTRMFLRRCAGAASTIGGQPVRIVKEDAGLALAGILHPRLLISERALAELSSEQLAAALRHEQAHQESRDNLKRLLILLAPPIFSRLRALERAWLKAAEWAADDRASGGDSNQSLTLAAALVRVARLQSGIVMPALVTSLVEADEDLSLRVDRLLRSRPLPDSQLRIGAIAFSMATLLICGIAANPAALRGVHQLLEHLLD